MADFQAITINGTAEQLEKLLGMDIVDSVTENSTNDQIPTARAVKDAIASGGGGGGGSAKGAVLYTPQTLTEEQKTQARENIGAAREFSDIKIYQASDLVAPWPVPEWKHDLLFEGPDHSPVELMNIRDGQNDDSAATVGQVQRMIQESGGGSGGGSLSITDDGNGNVAITATAGVTITDDGNGNVTIE